MKILLAEDENDLREVVTEYLELHGYRVTAVPNGAEAVKELSTDAFDAVVMDIMMPAMDGISAMKKIRETGNTVPAIFLTAKSQISDRVEGLDAGADDYLTKPFAMEELSARLRALNRRKRDFRVRKFSFGNFELDTESSELRAHNSIALSQKEVKLLSIFISGKDREISASEILSDVWQGENAPLGVVWMYVSFLNAKLRSVKANVTIEGDNSQNYRIREI